MNNKRLRSETENVDDISTTLKKSPANNTMDLKRVKRTGEVLQNVDINTTSSLIESNLINMDNVNKLKSSAKENCVDELEWGDVGDDFFDDLDSDEYSVKNSIDLSTWQMCKAAEVTKHSMMIEIVLVDTNNSSSIVQLKDFWLNTKIRKGDSVSVIAEWNSTSKVYVVNNETGFIVVNPQILISGTTVSNTFCMRKNVFAERFRCTSAPVKAMIIGTLAHEIFQTVIERDDIDSVDCIYEVMEDILSTKSSAIILYSGQMKREEAAAQLLNYAQQIFKLYTTHRHRNSTNFPVRRFVKVLDIEENLWVPRLGLKGKIDVTALVSEDWKTDEIDLSKCKVSPIELKTGRVSFSLDHRGQVLVYQMMMNQFKKDVDSGLLLYLIDGTVHEVKPDRNAQRDIIIMRNTCANYFSNGLLLSDINEFRENILKMKNLFNLPEPIDRIDACAKCSFNTVCSIFSKTDDSLLKQKNGFASKCDDFMKHLESNEIDYFLKWCLIVQMEEKSQFGGDNTKTLAWMDEPMLKAVTGRAVIGLKLDNEIIELNDRCYRHEFIFATTCFKEMHSQHHLDGLLNKGDFVIVTEERTPRVALGRIAEITCMYIAVELDKRLSYVEPEATFSIELYEFSNSSVGFNLGNLATLVEDLPENKLLRDIVIKKVKRLSTASDDKIKEIENIIQSFSTHLNADQINAIKATILTDNYALIKGFPGAGKTETIVTLIQVLYAMKKTVLITSHTNSAVDNILIRLVKINKSLPVMRIGSSQERLLKPYLEKVITRDMTSVKELDSIAQSMSIVGVTCMGMNHWIFTNKRFDFCIVDEATQVSQPTILRPLFSAKKFVLVGDPEQLSPLVRCHETKSMGADESLFSRLDCSESTLVLSKQYRMNSVICNLANSLTYNGQLMCGSNEVAQRTIKSALINIPNGFDWMNKLFNSKLENSIVLIDTGNVYEINKTQKWGSRIMNNSQPLDRERVDYNLVEAALVVKLIDILKPKSDSDLEHKVGVIAPYRLQVDLIRNILTFANHDDPYYNSLIQTDVNTVDQFQGRDMDVILYSCTRSDVKKDGSVKNSNEILDDWRRLTVAITRAKMKLIIVADVECLKKYEPFKELFRHINPVNIVNLNNDEYKFSWTDYTKFLLTEE